jgi:DNA-binding transcriptional MocR family regulator
MKLDGGERFRQHIAHIRATYSAMNDKLCACLDHHFPPPAAGSQESRILTYDKAEGGFFLWIRFDEKRIPDARQLLKVCNEKKVGFKPGYLSACDGDKFHNCARFSPAFYTEKEIEEGVRRLAEAVHTFLHK